MIRSMLNIAKLFFFTDLQNYRKYPSRILFSFFQIFLVVFLFYFISETLGEISILKSKYFPFVATGLSFQYFFSGVVNASSTRLEEYRDYGILEEVLFSRFPPWQIILTLGFQDISLAIIKSSIIFIAVCIFFKLKITFFFLIVSLFLTFFLGLSLSFVASCSFLIWKRFSLLEIGGTITTLFLSGVYFPIDVLPNFLQVIAKLNPLLHGLQIFRISLGLEGAIIGEYYIANSLMIIASSIFVLIPLNLCLYKLCLKRLKTFGISGHF